jgi:hypothetical protein
VKVVTNLVPFGYHTGQDRLENYVSIIQLGTFYVREARFNGRMSPDLESSQRGKYAVSLICAGIAHVYTY